MEAHVCARSALAWWMGVVIWLQYDCCRSNELLGLIPCLWGCFPALTIPKHHVD